MEDIFDQVANNSLEENDIVQPQVEPTEGNIFDQVADDAFEVNNFEYNAAVQNVGDRAPSSQKDVFKYSKEMQLPPEFVERNLDMIRQAKKTEELKRLKETNPNLALTLSDPNKLAAAQNDLEKLKKFDSFTRSLPVAYEEPGMGDALIRGYSDGYTQNKKSYYLGKIALGIDVEDSIKNFVALNKSLADRRQNEPEYMKEYNRERGKVSAELDKSFANYSKTWDLLSEGKIIDSLASFGAAGPQAIDSLLDAIAFYGTSGRAIAYQSANSLNNTLAPLIAGTAGLVAGASAGGAAGGALASIPGLGLGAAGGAVVGGVTGTFSTGFVLEFLNQAEEVLVENKVDLLDPDSIKRAFENPEILAEIKKKGTIKGVSVAAIETLTNVIGGRFLSGFGGATLGQKVGKVAAAQAVEATGEAAGEIGSSMLIGKEFTPELLLQGVEEGLMAMLTGGVLDSVKFTSGSIKEKAVAIKDLNDRSEQAKQFGSTLDGAIEQLQEMEVKDIAPDIVTEIIGTNVEGQQVFMQADEFEDHWKSQGENPQEKADELLPNGRRDLENAKQEGGPVTIPVEDYVTKFSQEESFEALSKLVRKDPGAMSTGEGERLTANIPRLLGELSKQARVEQNRRKKIQEGREGVVREIEGQLLNLPDFDAKSARKVAELYAANIEAMAAKNNKDILDFYQQRSLEIRRGTKEDITPGALFQDKRTGINLRSGETLAPELSEVTEIDVLDLEALDFEKYVPYNLETFKQETAVSFQDKVFNNKYSKQSFKVSLKAINNAVDELIKQRLGEEAGKEIEVKPGVTTKAAKRKEKVRLLQSVDNVTALANFGFLAQNARRTSISKDGTETYHAVANVGNKRAAGIRFEVKDGEVTYIQPVSFRQPIGRRGVAEGPVVQGPPTGRISISDFATLINQGKGRLSRVGRKDVYFQQDAKVLNKHNQDAMGFYSNLRDLVVRLKIGTVPAKNLLNRLRKEGAKKDELEYTDLASYLEAKGDEKVNEQQILEYLDNNGVKISQIILAEDFAAPVEVDSDLVSASDINFEEDRISWSDYEPYYDADFIVDYNSEFDYHVEQAESQLVKYLTENVINGYSFAADNIISQMKEDEEYAQEVRQAFEDEELEDFIRKDQESEINEAISDYASDRANDPNDETYSFMRMRDNENGIEILYNPELGIAKLEGPSGEIYDMEGEFNGNANEMAIVAINKLIEEGEIAEPLEPFYEQDLSLDIQLDEDGDFDEYIEHPQTGQEIGRLYLSDIEDQEWNLTLQIGNIEEDIDFSGTPEQAKARVVRELQRVGLIRVDSNAESQEGTIDVDPFEGMTEEERALAEERQKLENPRGNVNWRKHSLIGGENYIEILLTLPESKGTFTHSLHYRGYENFVVHVRISERTDAEGKKVYFIEEMQSDWHQQGREKGYRPEGREKEAIIDQISSLTVDIGKTEDEKTAIEQSEQYKALEDKQEEERTRINKQLTDLEENEIAKLREENDKQLEEAQKKYETFLEEIDAKILKKEKEAEQVDSVTSEEGRKIWSEMSQLRDQKSESSNEYLTTKRRLRSEYNKKADALRDPLEEEARNIRDKYELLKDALTEKVEDKLYDLKSKQRELQRSLDRGVPDAPFKDTQAWIMLALKRVLRIAAEKGMDSVAWTPAIVHQHRWGTDKVAWKRVKLKNEKNQETEGFIVSSQEQVGGTAGAEGGTIEELAIARGELRSGENFVTSEEELLKELTSILSRERGTRSLKSLTSTIWKDMQATELNQTGVRKPRDEGMEFFYNRALPKAATEYIKKIDKKAVPTPTDVEATYYEAFDSEGELIGFTDQDAERKSRPYENVKKLEQLKALSIPLTPELVDYLLKGQPLFQKDGTGPKGMIDFSDPDKMIITIFKNANKSTILHELGHAFLENMRRVAIDLDQMDASKFTSAQKQFRRDQRALLNHFGVNSFADITTEHHEDFARMTEAFLMEGKAPSKRLRSAFNTFKTWLINIYKNIRGISRAAGQDIELTPEMREIFNRLLATEEEIAEVQSEAGYDETSITSFLSALGFKEGDDESDRLIQAHSEAQDEASLQLYKEQVAQRKKKKTREYNARKKVIKEEVTEEVKDNPLFVARDAIKTHKIDDQPILGYKTIKFNTAQLKEMLTPEEFRSFPRSLYSADGISPNETANLLGFNSGKDLVDAIKSNPSREEYIRLTTDQRLNQEFPNFMDPAQEEDLKVAALNAVDNDMREKALKLEFELMLQKSPAQAKALIKKIAKRLPSTKEMRQAAEVRVGDTAYNQAKPYIFKRIENKTRRIAVEEFVKGNYDKAAKSKLQEIFNHNLSKVAEESTSKIDKEIKKNNKRLGKSDKDLAKKGHLDMFKAAQAIMQRYGMLTEAQADRLDIYLSQLQKYDPTAFAKVQGLTDSLVQIPERRWQELTVREVQDILEVIDSLYDLAKSEKQITVDGKKVDKDKAIKEMLEKLATLDGQALKKEDTGWKKFKGFISSVEANMTRVEHLTNFLDNFDFGGPFRKYVWNRANEGQQLYTKSLEQYYSKLNEILKSYFPKILEDDQDINLDKYFPNLDPQLNTLKKFELVMALVHSGNDSNKRKLLLGREWGSEDMDGNLVTDFYDKFIADMIEREIITKDMMDGVQAIWDLFEEIKPEIQKTHKEVLGYYFKEIEATPFETPFGTYRGGYAPAVTDPLLIEKQAQRENEASTEMDVNTYAFAATPKGFTKERVQAYNRALSLDFRIIRAHVEKAVRFSTLEPVVADLNKVINAGVKTAIDQVKDRTLRSKLQNKFKYLLKTSNPKFSDALFEVNPNLGNEVLRPWIARIATQKTSKPADTKAGREFQRWLGFFRRNANMQLMFVNVVNTVENLTDIPALFTRMKARSFREGLQNYIKSPKEAANLVKDLSPYMKDRMEQQIFEINDTYKDLTIRKNTVLGKINNLQDQASKHTYVMQQALQNVVEVAAWLGAYNEGVVRFNNETQAARYADSVIREVMGANRPIDIAGIEAGGALQQVVLTFYSYFLNKGNLVRYSSKETKIKAYALGIAAPAILSAIFRRAVKGNLDEDDDDEYIDDIYDVFFLSQLRFMAAIIPGGGTAARFLEGQFNDKPYDDRLSISPMLGMLESVKGVTGLMTKDELKSKDVRDTLSFFGTMTGVPLGAAGRPIGFMIDLEQGKQAAENPTDLARGLVTGKSGKK